MQTRLTFALQRIGGEKAVCFAAALKGRELNAIDETVRVSERKDAVPSIDGNVSHGELRFYSALNLDSPFWT
jgi:hypothetical protein